MYIDFGGAHLRTSIYLYKVLGAILQNCQKTHNYAKAANYFERDKAIAHTRNEQNYNPFKNLHEFNIFTVFKRNQTPLTHYQFLRLAFLIVPGIASHNARLPFSSTDILWPKMNFH